MTREDEVRQAAAIGADAAGFIFYDRSKRSISIQQAYELMQAMPPLMSAVAVVVNPKTALVDEIVRKLPIQCLQFHGDESPEFCEQFAFPYIKAIPAVSAEAIVRAADHYTAARAILLDTPCDSRGGSGKVFDWRTIPPLLDKAVIMAGGLHAGNVREAVSIYRPYAVDVCSGIESAPGIKDHHQMKLFVQALGDM
ncbi:N-(5'-phosphoribosyl)anthranilate isomerase [Legionella rubrilucens]|uniref:N-(5'-phosphoribosyl)anthranilate isomerase n=2 Tax=Legionella rubrilucens TaxID=458 RepID=A0A0W0XWM9_9GAMM|nr:N-(5'-phosphoribosyl)anthranilate isomerase [Legionella rubrilucens]